MADDRPARPDLLHWLWYALGGGLPPKYRDWVLHDATARTWWLRQLLRSAVQALPIAVVVALLIPGSPGIRLMAAAGGVAVALFFVLSFVDEAVERRVAKAGFPRGYAKALRERPRTPQEEAEARRYAQRYRGGDDPRAF
jgi:hypothetical protein